MRQNPYMHNPKKGMAVGLGLTAAVHICVLLVLAFNGLTYLYPPPEESSFVIDFTEQEQTILETEHGEEPASEEVDPEEPVELTQESESPVEADVPNTASDSEPDKFGDVDIPEPEPEKPVINQKALFPGMGRKDSEASSAHSSKEADKHFKDGQADGNARNGETEGKSNAHLQGRKVVGGLVKPEFDRQESGVVVVTIWVDPYGNVRNAVAGAPGTTVTDKTLLTEARNAAMKTHFSKLTNITQDTPELQEGRITYIFKLQ